MTQRSFTWHHIGRGSASRDRTMDIRQAISGAMIIAGLIAGCSDRYQRAEDRAEDMKSLFDESNASNHEPDSVEVRFGSSSGECFGYCRSEFELHPWGLECTRIGWDTAVYPEQHQVVPIAKGVYQTILEAVDTTSLWKEFNQVTIGCPDCADGGSCWLVVRRDGVSKYLNYDCIGGAGKHRSFVDLVRIPATQVTWWEPGDAYVPHDRTECLQ